MKRLIRKIISAWAIASMLLFWALLTFVEPSTGCGRDSYHFLLAVNFVVAVTGAGWLWYEFGGNDERD